MNTTPLEKVLTAIGDYTGSEKSYQARCPAHDDRHASLSLSETEDGTVLVKCHAGCTAEAVVSALGLTMHDLFSSVDVVKTAQKPRKTGVLATAKGKTKTFATAAAAVTDLEKRHGKRSARWIYHNAEADLVGVIVRWDLPNGKKNIRPVSRHRHGWTTDGMPTPRPVYRLPDVLRRQGCVFVAEGEKAADAVRSLGLLATTSAHGAQSAKGTDWTPLAGREVVILPDHDDAGAKYAEDVITLLDALTPKPNVKVVHLPGLPDHGDAVDFLAARRAAGLDDVAIRAEIESLSDNAEVVQPDETGPDPAPLAYQPFPVDLLPDPICGYITASAAAIGCDHAFIAMPLLAAIASAIGSNRRIQLKRRWTEPAILWALVIAPSGGHKSPGHDAAMMPVRKRQEKAKRRYAEALNRYATAMEEFKAELSEWKGAGGSNPKPREPKKPEWERCWTDDTTIEALASLLLQNPRGLLISADELSTWFASFERYKSGKGSTDAPRWLNCHGGRALVIDRKTGEPRTIHVPHATVSVAGGIQPGVLRRTLSREQQESGMAARFLFAMPPKRQKRWTEAEIDEQLESDVLAVFEKLYGLQPGHDDDGEPIPRLLRMSATAKRDFWVPFYNEHGAEQVAMDDDLSATWSKLEGYAARLALVHHLVRVAANDPTVGDPDTVDETSMAAGIALSRWFGCEAKRVFAMLAEDDAEQETRALLEMVERLGGTVTVRDLRRHSRQYRTPDDAEAALQALAKRGLGTWQANPKKDRGGRPTTAFVLHGVAKTPLKPGGNEGFGNGDSKKNGDMVKPPAPALPVDDADDWGVVA